MERKPFRIEMVATDSESIRTFVFGTLGKVVPGQFVMAWIPDVGEKPFSVSYSDYDIGLGITVRKRGKFTESLFAKTQGDTIWMCGPKGNGFPMEELNGSNVIMVGGGTGIAPLAFLAEQLKQSTVTSFLGARTESEIIQEVRFGSIGSTFVATEDGTEGRRGMVTELLKRRRFPAGSKAVICGPERMMSATATILAKQLEPKDIYLSLERYMKCGEGLCGACTCGGYRVCTDGPVFPYEKLMRVEDFGNFERDGAGAKLPYGAASRTLRTDARNGGNVSKSRI